MYNIGYNFVKASENIFEILNNFFIFNFIIFIDDDFIIS